MKLNHKGRETSRTNKIPTERDLLIIKLIRTQRVEPSSIQFASSCQLSLTQIKDEFLPRGVAILWVDISLEKRFLWIEGRISWLTIVFEMKRTVNKNLVQTFRMKRFITRKIHNLSCSAMNELAHHWIRAINS